MNIQLIAECSLRNGALSSLANVNKNHVSLLRFIGGSGPPRSNSDLMVIVRCSHSRHCRPFWFLSQFDFCFEVVGSHTLNFRSFRAGLSLFRDLVHGSKAARRIQANFSGALCPSKSGLMNKHIVKHIVRVFLLIKHVVKHLFPVQIFSSALYRYRYTSQSGPNHKHIVKHIVNRVRQGFPHRGETALTAVTLVRLNCFLARAWEQKPEAQMDKA